MASKTASARKRSESAKKAAATRKAREAAAKLEADRARSTPDETPPEPAEGTPPSEQTQPDESEESPPQETTYPDESVEGVEEQTTTEEYQPKRLPLENASLDQHAAEKERQAELQAQRDLHNKRTGDASLDKGSWS